MNKINFENIPLDKEVYTFEIDDILYEKKDYVLQIYYLFANFVEYTEGRPLAHAVLDFMKSHYEQSGEELVLEKTLAHFGLGDQYIEQFGRLYANGQLPLKLFLVDPTKEFLQKLTSLGKKYVS